MKELLLAWFLVFFSLVYLGKRAISQDLDHDGLPDSLEQALALKFAPEWHFHQKIKGIHSRQNRDESIRPTKHVFWDPFRLFSFAGGMPLFWSSYQGWGNILIGFPLMWEELFYFVDRVAWEG